MEKFYRIGDVSKICEIPIKTLRFYEEEGLIKPVKVDIYTGYRYYDDDNVLELYRIKLLKNLGFTLKEIREFDEKSLDKKIKEIKNQVIQLKDKKAMISYLQKQKGEKIMKPFINDEKAIGKWTYIATANSKEEYLKGKCNQENNFIKNLFFLPKGKGYWIFERWTKGEIYQFRGNVFTYEIEGNKLYLKVVYENKPETMLVFEKVDSNEYNSEEIMIKDKIDYPFVIDKNALGLWIAVDFINIKDKRNYTPKKCAKEFYLKSLTLNANGEFIGEYVDGKLFKGNWTKEKLINNVYVTASNYEIKEINGEKYMILDWKSGDYSYQGFVDGCYVLKKF